MGGRRAYGLTLVLLLLGGASALLAAGRTWATAIVPGGLGDEAVAVAGADLSPGLRALGLLALAGVLAVLATRQSGRRLVGLALAVAAAIGGVTATWRAATLDARVAEEVLAERGAEVQQVSGTGWPWVAVAATLLVLAAGVLTALGGAGWPALGGRFERAPGGAPARTAPADRPRRGTAGADATAGAAGAAGTRPEAGSAPPGPAADGARRSWDALDRGEDPTA